MIGRSLVTTVMAAVLPLGIPRTIDLPVQTLPVLGGSGGTEFSRSCNSGSVLTGLRYRSGAVVDAVGLLCRPVDGNGNLLPESSVGTLAGGGGGTLKIARCAAGRVVAGAKIYYGSYVDGLALVCREWKPTTRTMATASGNAVFIGRVTSSHATELCDSPAQPVVKMRGRADMLVDAIGFSCNEP